MTCCLTAPGHNLNNCWFLCQLNPCKYRLKSSAKCRHWPRRVNYFLSCVGLCGFMASNLLTWKPQQVKWSSTSFPAIFPGDFVTNIWYGPSKVCRYSYQRIGGYQAASRYLRSMNWLIELIDWSSLVPRSLWQHMRDDEKYITINTIHSMQNVDRMRNETKIMYFQLAFYS